MTDDELQKALASTLSVAEAVAALEKRLAPESGAEYGLMSDEVRASVRKTNRVVLECIDTLLSIAAKSNAARESAALNQLQPLDFRRQALQRAMDLDVHRYAGDLSEVECNTVDGMARTLAIVSAGYNWTMSDDGRLAACVAGDQGYASTGIVVEQDANAGAAR